jgi:hypothetical protein
MGRFAPTCGGGRKPGRGVGGPFSAPGGFAARRAIPPIGRVGHGPGLSTFSPGGWSVGAGSPYFSTMSMFAAHHLRKGAATNGIVTRKRRRTAP